MAKLFFILILSFINITAFGLECDFDYTGEYQLKVLPKLSGHQEYVECSNFNLKTEKGRKDLFRVLSKSSAEYVKENGSSYIENKIGAKCWKVHYLDEVPSMCSLGDEYLR